MAHKFFIRAKLLSECKANSPRIESLFASSHSSLLNLINLRDFHIDFLSDKNISCDSNLTLQFNIFSGSTNIVN